MLLVELCTIGRDGRTIVKDGRTIVKDGSAIDKGGSAIDKGGRIIGKTPATAVEYRVKDVGHASESTSARTGATDVAVSARSSVSVP